MEAGPKQGLMVWPIAGRVQRALLVLWLLRERRYEFGVARRTILADFELHDERLGVEQRG